LEKLYYVCDSGVK